MLDPNPNKKKQSLYTVKKTPHTHFNTTWKRMLVEQQHLLYLVFFFNQRDARDQKLKRKEGKAANQLMKANAVDVSN